VYTVVFRLKWPSASFLNLLASPFSWIFKADILAKDQRWYEKNVMGTGPFTFVEYVKGSHWVGKKNPNYWDKGKPYLDGYRAIFKFAAGVMVPETPFATPPAELEKLAGYGRDINKSRAEARRLLREAGVPDGYAFTFKNRGVPMPYEPVGIWLIDQWRQIGLNVRMETNETSKFLADLRDGNFDVSMDANCGYA